VLDKGYASIRSSGVSGESFRKAVQQTIGRHDAALQTRSSRVMEYARALYSGAGVQSVTGYGAAVQKVTSEQLKSVAARYLDPASLRMGIARGGAR
jgi:predicted Zn-dependent peptidase